ncbi:hypothetical protein HDU87_005445 [Geranomyces variabilis]|uniref:Uncharacterized protein n=1 Tax=Geranomyces variabilis TaxID=109894 RepID=A0AAD5TIL5_9FUNG|nr:hypothetical protein HDU87_005445 [Geranomyces variabilis]
MSSWHSRPAKRRADDIADNSETAAGGARSAAKRSRLHEPAPVYTPVVQNPPPRPRFPLSTTTTMKRRRDDEDQEEAIPTVNLLPLNKRLRQENERPVAVSPDTPLYHDPAPMYYAESQAAAAAALTAAEASPALALVPYARNKPLLTATATAAGNINGDAAVTFQVNELLTGRLRAQAWEPYRHAGLDEANGRLVVYRGGKAWDHDATYNGRLDQEEEEEEEDGQDILNELDWTQGQRFEEIVDGPEVVADVERGVCMMDIDA